jgi:hypothetical protein
MREFHIITQIWRFTCLACQHTWQDTFEERHADNGHGRDAVTWHHAGAASTPPHSDPYCPSCQSLHVKTLPVGIRPSTAQTPPVPEQRPGSQGREPAEPASPPKTTAGPNPHTRRQITDTLSRAGTAGAQ